MTLIRPVLLTVVALVCATGSVFGQESPPTSHVDPSPKTFDEALARGRDNDVPVLLEFFTEW